MKLVATKTANVTTAMSIANFTGCMFPLSNPSWRSPGSADPRPKPGDLPGIMMSR
ncbi:MAG: hypothetical protein ACM3X1_08800 [Ignavibacteriales bacterium]